MNSRDKFRNVVKPGTSLTTLSQVNEYFHIKFGFGVYRYEFSSSPSKPVDYSFLSKADMRVCSICGSRLYTTDTAFDDDGRPQHTVKSKKYMRFMTGDSRWKYTCHGISRCLKKVSFSRSEVPEAGTMTAPTYEEFIQFTGDVDDPAYDFSAEDFEYRVRPFLSKWLILPISKMNVNEFIEDVETCLQHLDRYEEEAHASIRDRILSFVGVSP